MAFRFFANLAGFAFAFMRFLEKQDTSSQDDKMTYQLDFF